MPTLRQPEATDRRRRWAPDRLTGMEAVFIALMALVVLLSGYVALLVVYRLFRAER